MSGNIVALPRQDCPSFPKEDNPENAEIDAVINKVWYMFNNTKMNFEKLRFFRNEILSTNIYVEEFENFSKYWIRTKVKFFTISEFLEWHKIWLRGHPRKGLDACSYNICKSNPPGHIHAYNEIKKYSCLVKCRCNPDCQFKSTDRLSFEQEIGKLGFKIINE